jgi:(p)ppGpp synthase/HD superfamily hydrolase
MSVDDARAFAIEAHGDQRYGSHPYAVHLDRVAALVREHVGDDETLITVAYLHDVVEDTAISEADVRARFGDEVALAVSGLSDPPGENRREKKARLNERLASLDPEVPGERGTLVVKAADRLANVLACLEHDPGGKLDMYRREHDGIQAAARRPGLCDSLWTALDEALRS